MLHVSKDNECYIYLSCKLVISKYFCIIESGLYFSYRSVGDPSSYFYNNESMFQIQGNFLGFFVALSRSQWLSTSVFPFQPL